MPTPAYTAALRSATSPVCEPLESRRLLAFGDFDPTFGDEGVVFSPFRIGHLHRDVTLQADGRIVTLEQETGDPRQWRISRLLEDGSFDESFNGDGLAEFRLSDSAGERPAQLQFNALADGTFIVHATANDITQGYLLKFGADGERDTSFGEGGLVALDNFRVNDVEIDPSGNLAVVGNRSIGDDDDGGFTQASIARVSTSGSLVTSFGDSGFADVAAGEVAVASHVGFDTQDRYVVGGSLVTLGDQPQDTQIDYLVARLGPNGQVDASYGDGGVATADAASNSGGLIGDFLVEPSGEAVILTRRLEQDGFLQPADDVNDLIRFTASGALDGGFGDGGIAEVARIEEANGLTIRPILLAQPNGGYIVSSQIGQPNLTSIPPFAVLTRVADDGSVLESVNTLDRLTAGLAPATTAPQAIVAEPDGQLVAVGWTSMPQDDFARLGTATVRLDGVAVPPPPPPGDNEPPTVDSLTDSPDPANVGDTITLQALGVADPDGDDGLIARFFREADGGDVLVGTDADGGDGYTAAVDTTGLAAGTYDYHVVVSDLDGAESDRATATNTLQDAPPDNRPPTIDGLSDSPDPAVVGSTITLEALGVADPDGDDRISVAFFREDDDGDVPVGVDLDGGNGFSVEVPTSGLAAGEYVYYAIATDPAGADSGRATATNTLIDPPDDNQPPVVGALSAAPEPVVMGDDLTLTATGVTDADGNVVRIEFFREAGEVDVSVGVDADGGDGYAVVIGTGGLAAGVYTYYAVAVDDDGARSAAAFADSTVVEAPPPPPPPAGEIAFGLLDAGADVRLGALEEGAVLLRSQLPASLSVEALLPGAFDSADSVRFELTGPGGLSYANTENVGFYTLFTNQGGDFAGDLDELGLMLPAGDYLLSATAYAADGAGGDVLGNDVVRFSIVDDVDARRVLSLTLVDADTDATVLELVDGMTVDAGDVPVSASVLAVTDPATVGSVRFVLGGPGELFRDHVEMIRPYTLFENLGGDYFGGALPAGAYTLAVTPYGGLDATGDAGETLTVSFTIA